MLLTLTIVVARRNSGLGGGVPELKTSALGLAFMGLTTERLRRYANRMDQSKDEKLGKAVENIVVHLEFDEKGRQKSVRVAGQVIIMYIVKCCLLLVINNNNNNMLEIPTGFGTVLVLLGTVTTGAILVDLVGLTTVHACPDGLMWWPTRTPASRDHDIDQPEALVHARMVRLKQFSTWSCWDLGSCLQLCYFIFYFLF